MNEFSQGTLIFAAIAVLGWLFYLLGKAVDYLATIADTLRANGEKLNDLQEELQQVKCELTDRKVREFTY